MKRWIVASTALMAVALVLVVSMRRGSTARKDAARSENQASSSANELRALRQEVESLKRTARIPQIQHITQNVAPSASTTAETLAANAAPEPPEDPKQRQRAAFAELEAKFASQSIDTAWSVPTVHAIRDAIRSEAAGTEILEAECATSLCRIVVRHGDSRAQIQLGSTLANVPAFHAGVVYDYDRDAKPPQTTLLVLREGHSFQEKS